MPNTARLLADTRIRLAAQALANDHPVPVDTLGHPDKTIDEILDIIENEQGPPHNTR